MRLRALAMGSTDKRAQKTLKLLRDTWFDLLGQVGAEKITVTLLAQKANISRKTFYAHYETLKDFCRSAVKDLLPVTCTVFTTETYEKYLEMGKTKEFEDFYREQELRLNKELREHPAELKILLSPKNYDWFMDTLADIISETLPECPGGKKETSVEGLEYNLIRSAAISSFQWKFRCLDVSSHEILKEYHEFSYRNFLRMCELMSELSRKNRH